MPARIDTGATLVAVMFMVSGCGDSSDGPERVSVTGSVTFDGTPVTGGEISFIPADGGGAADAAAVTDGKFSANVTPGSKRVEITATRADPDNMVESAVNPGQKEPAQVQYIPETYNTGSTLKAEIKADGPNDLPAFDLKSGGG